MRVISADKDYEIRDIELTNKVAGQKALGLMKVPDIWRLPFFVIDKSVFETYIKLDQGDKKDFLFKITEKIKNLSSDWNSSKIIIRSSGELEGMAERGKYDSKEGSCEECIEILNNLFSDLICENGSGISYIVQPYIERKRFGHLSNERRVSFDKRDWLIEFEQKDEINKIATRPWRISFEKEKLFKTELLCDSENDIKNVLRYVAYYYSIFENSNRVHIEFVWNGEKIFIVQLDIEHATKKEVNPMDYNNRIQDSNELDNMEILRPISKEDGKKYKKVKNVFIYESLKIKTAPLYILDDITEIEQLANGKVSKKLKHDILILTSKSMVIRTDINCDEQLKRQLLPRSNEIRDYDEAIKWLIDNAKKLLKEYSQVAFLCHVFIPAISAAFSYAMPGNRIVKIQSLWGLPEGLYYNAHDSFVVDTMTKSINHLNQQEFEEKRSDVDFKGFYIAPDNNGKWKELMTQIPYDWKRSITKEQAKEIAYGSRLISESEKEPVSIMWFVGIDEEYYGVDCLPWHHEKYSKNMFSHDTYKKKYFSEKEIVIRDRNDLEKIKSDNDIRTITIHPSDDFILRDRNFIDDVGKIAKEREITIFLEGTILAHPIYRLLEQTSKVQIAKKYKEYIEKMEFNKLVRDKIPEKIERNSENAICYVANNEILVRLLSEKLIEEIYELNDAIEREAIIEELADVKEVVLALGQAVNNIDNIYSCYYRKLNEDKLIKIKQKELLFYLQDLNNLSKEFVQKGNLNKKFGEVEVLLSREQQKIELELRFCKKIEYNDINEKAINKYGNIFELGYQILDEKNINKLKMLIKRINNEIDNLLRNIQVLDQEFEEIRAKKNMKNGAFEKGFVLKETNIKEGNAKCDIPDDVSFLHDTYIYPQINELPFEQTNYIDYRYINHGELLIRTNFPLCVNIWNIEFESEKIKQYFGEYSKMIISIIRKEALLHLKIYIIHSENYIQRTIFDY